MRSSTFKPPKEWLHPIPVDNYASTFEALASEKLPHLFAQLEIQLAKALPLSLFDTDNLGAARITDDPAFKAHIEPAKDLFADAQAFTRNRYKDTAQKNDFAGTYVFRTVGVEVSPFYVGITQALCRRLRKHLRGKRHNEATLIYQFLRTHSGENGKRKELDMKSEIASYTRKWLRNQCVAILPIASPVERYAFELYASMKLKTGRWNSFETH